MPRTLRRSAFAGPNEVALCVYNVHGAAGAGQEINVVLSATFDQSPNVNLPKLSATRLWPTHAWAGAAGNIAARPPGIPGAWLRTNNAAHLAVGVGPEL